MTQLPAAAPVVFRRGDRGPAVIEIRDRLTAGGAAPEPAPAPAVFDDELDSAVRAFQQRRGLLVDGLVGPATWRAMEEARWRLGDRVLVHVPGALLVGDDVLALQQRLLDLGFKVGRVDGRFGPGTEAGLREFQRNIGLPPDGTCGPATLKALARLAPMVSGGSPNALRAQERVRVAGPALAGKVVVVDPAPARVADPALRAFADRMVLDLAGRVEGRLGATGVQAYLTRLAGQPEPDEAERAELANRTGAHLCVSLGVDASDNRDASGVSSYYWGIDAHGVGSSAGERFAGLVQREVVARTGLTDLRSHARSWDLLRRTAMPAVWVDVGYVTNPGDAARLGDPRFRDIVAEAVVVAVQRMYLPSETDPHTGVLRLTELRRWLASGPPAQPGR